MTIPAIINSIVFLILSGLHFYWTFGGTLAFGEALPKNVSGERILNPTKFDSAIVGLGLLVFSAFYFFKLGWMPITLPSKLLSATGWIIVAIFLMRAIGDFRYVGFFKKIKNTDFARQDSRYYSPLCVVLAFNGALVEVMSVYIL